MWRLCYVRGTKEKLPERNSDKKKKNQIVVEVLEIFWVRNLKKRKNFVVLIKETVKTDQIMKIYGSYVNVWV